MDYCLLCFIGIILVTTVHVVEQYQIDLPDRLNNILYVREYICYRLT